MTSTLATELDASHSRRCYNPIQPKLNEAKP